MKTLYSLRHTLKRISPMNKEIVDMAARDIIQYVIEGILTNVSTTEERGELSSVESIRKEINDYHESLLSLTPNTPLGIVHDRLMSFMEKNDYCDPTKMDSLRKKDITTDSLLEQTIYMYSSGYSVQLNELRTIIPNDIDKAIVHVHKSITPNNDNPLGFHRSKFFTWGRVEDPAYQDVLLSFLQQNVNILKSPKNTLSDVHNFTSIMKRILFSDNFLDTSLPDNVVKAHAIPDKLQKQLTSSVAFENFINYTKTVLSLNGQVSTMRGLLNYIEDIKAHAPVVSDLLNSPYQDDMSDNLVANIDIMNKRMMLIEGLIWYLMDVTFKNAVILPGYNVGNVGIVINQRVYNHYFDTEDAESAGKDDIINVIHYLSSNTPYVSPGASGINKWVPHRGGISYQRIMELQNRATKYRERTEHVHLASQRQEEIYQIRDAISAYLDTWFTEFKKTYGLDDLRNIETYNKLHTTHKQILLNKIRRLSQDDRNVFDRHLMDYFVAIRNSPLLSILYQSTRAFYENYMANKRTDNVHKQPTHCAQEHAIIHTFLDFFMKKYTVALPKDD